MSKLTAEQVAFRADMVRHTAQLMDFAKPYVGRLRNADKDYFLEQAFEIAWQHRKDFKPEKASLLRWWEKCLCTAAETRQTWQVSTFDGRTNSVLGVKLGREGL